MPAGLAERTALAGRNPRIHGAENLLLTLTPLDWIYAGAALLAVAVIFAFLRFRKRDPERVERRRRERIERIGRVGQCEILEILEPQPAGPSFDLRARLKWLIPSKTRRPAGQLILYRYMVSGVTYETAQDFGESAGQIRLPLAGELARVKYDPANPSNSILLIGSWSTPKTATPRKGN